MDETRRRFVITAEVRVEVTDAAILRRTALDRVTEAGFVADGDRGVDEVRAVERDAVHADVAAALDWLVDADAIVQDVEGAEVVGSTVSVGEECAAGAGADEMPDFAALFAVCHCGADDSDDCSGFQMTPRSAAILWAVAQFHADLPTTTFSISAMLRCRRRTVGGWRSPTTRGSPGGRTRCGGAKLPVHSMTLGSAVDRVPETWRHPDPGRLHRRRQSTGQRRRRTGPPARSGRQQRDDGGIGPRLGACRLGQPDHRDRARPRRDNPRLLGAPSGCGTRP